MNTRTATIVSDRLTWRISSSTELTASPRVGAYRCHGPSSSDKPRPRPMEMEMRRRQMVLSSSLNCAKTRNRLVAKKILRRSCNNLLPASSCTLQMADRLTQASRASEAPCCFAWERRSHLPCETSATVDKSPAKASNAENPLMANDKIGPMRISKTKLAVENFWATNKPFVNAVVIAYLGEQTKDKVLAS